MLTAGRKSTLGLWFIKVDKEIILYTQLLQKWQENTLEIIRNIVYQNDKINYVHNIMCISDIWLT